MAFSFYLEFIRLSITSVWFLDLDRVQYIVHVLWTPLFLARPRCHVKIYSYIKKSAYQDNCFFFQYQTRTTEWFDFFFPECNSRECYVKNML